MLVFISAQAEWVAKTIFAQANGKASFEDLDRGKRWVTKGDFKKYLKGSQHHKGAPACSMPGDTLGGLAFSPAIMTMPLCGGGPA